MANKRRLIDIAQYENMVDAAVCQIQIYRSGNGCCDVMNFKAENIPTVDAVEVVRCKDCKYGTAWENKHGYTAITCRLMCADVTPDDFCSFGERKSGTQPQREDA